MTKLRCDMCHKPLKGVRYVVQTLLGGAMVVGPECFRKEKKARKEMLARNTPAQIEALRAKISARKAAMPHDLTAARKNARTDEDAASIAWAQDEIERLQSEVEELRACFSAASRAESAAHRDAFCLHAWNEHDVYGEVCTKCGAHRSIPVNAD